MTIDEAIEIIECGDISNRWGKDGEEVEKMAIKALKQEPCEDAISKQAVLDILKDKWNMFSDANDAMQESIDTIESLRPVSSSENPNNCEDDKPCTECSKYDHEKHNCPHFCHVIKGVLKDQANKSEWQKDHEILKAYSDGANEVLDKIRLDIAQEIIPRSSDKYDWEARWQNMGLRIALKVIGKYKAEGIKE